MDKSKLLELLNEAIVKIKDTPEYTEIKEQAVTELTKAMRAIHLLIRDD